LVNRGLVDTVTSGFKVSPGHDLESITDIDHESTRLIRGIVPLLILAPDLKARDRNGKEQGGETKVCMTMHAKALGSLFCGLLHRSE
jgi:hypothetical protein